MTHPQCRIFVSSTYEDLKNEREAVRDIIHKLKCIPAGMEDFFASNDSPWEIMKDEIESSDCYLLIVGGRYGSTDLEGVSYTEREYDYAVTQNLPVLAFIHSNPDDIPFGKSEISARGRKKLNRFKKKVGRHLYSSWRTTEELKEKVFFSVNQFNFRKMNERLIVESTQNANKLERVNKEAENEEHVVAANQSELFNEIGVDRTERALAEDSEQSSALQDCLVENKEQHQFFFSDFELDSIFDKEFEAFEKEKRNAKQQEEISQEARGEEEERQAFVKGDANDFAEVINISQINDESKDARPGNQSTLKPTKSAISEIERSRKREKTVFACLTPIYFAGHFIFIFEIIMRFINLIKLDQAVYSGVKYVAVALILFLSFNSSLKFNNINESMTMRVTVFIFTTLVGINFLISPAWFPNVWLLIRTLNNN